MTLDQTQPAITAASRDHTGVRRPRGRPKGTTRAAMLQRMCEALRDSGGAVATSKRRTAARPPRVETLHQSDQRLVVVICLDPFRLKEHVRRRRRVACKSLKLKVGPNLASGARISLPPPLSPVHSSSSSSDSDGPGDESSQYPRRPFRGVLSGSDADTTETRPSDTDSATLLTARRSVDTPYTEHNGHPRVLLKQVSQIRHVHIANVEIDTWYTAPYPEEFSRNRVLPVCEFCLKYMNSDFVAFRHSLKCPFQFPPGNEIYRCGDNSVFEVDGRKTPLFCQNLCLLAKMFLDSKALYYDVEPFMFYVLTHNDAHGCHFVGYFSKEKQPSGRPYNVSCILTLPTAQRRGYGTFLIEFSYLLTRVQKKVGTPERPLSELGLASYTSYWRWRVCQELHLLAAESVSLVSIDRISQSTAMTPDDVLLTLESLGFLIVDEFSVCLDVATDVVERVLAQHEQKPRLKVHPECLLWVSPLEGM